MKLKINIGDGANYLEIVRNNTGGVIYVASNLKIELDTLSKEEYQEQILSGFYKEWNAAIDAFESTMLAVAALGVLSDEQLTEVVHTVIDALSNNLE